MKKGIQANFSLETARDLEIDFGSDFEKDLVKQIQGEIQDEIDHMVLQQVEFNEIKRQIEKNKSLAILYRDSKNPMINKYVKKILSNHIESDAL